MPRIRPSAWSGWPADWQTPSWNGNGSLAALADTAWMCLDYNAQVLMAMPPYLVNDAPTLNADWLRNPDPDLYTCWEEFAKQLFWSYQLGEAFVLATSWYATGWPARFHVVPNWSVNVELGRDGTRVYNIGSATFTRDQLLHIRYQGTVADAHGHGPLEVGYGRLIAAQLLTRYATSLVSSGGIPSSVLIHPQQQSPSQAAKLKADWVEARVSSIGEPAVLSGGIEWRPTQMNPADMALMDITHWNDSRICSLLHIPPPLVGLKTTGDSMTYSNMLMYLEQHWRTGLRPMAQIAMSSLSGWLLPRQTRVELNSDAYVQPEPLQRAQTYQALNSIVDPVTGQPAMTVDEIRAAERLTDQTPQDAAAGVLR